MTLQENKEYQREIRNKIVEYEEKLRVAREEEYQIKSELMRPLVNRCFKGFHPNDLTKDFRPKENEIYYRIIGIPPRTFTHYHESTNYFQIPCLCIDFNNKSPFPFRSTLFSHCSEYENPLEAIRKEYEEIPLEKFLVAAQECFDRVVRKEY